MHLSHGFPTARNIFEIPGEKCCPQTAAIFLWLPPWLSFALIFIFRNKRKSHGERSDKGQGSSCFSTKTMGRGWGCLVQKPITTFPLHWAFSSHSFMLSPQYVTTEMLIHHLSGKNKFSASNPIHTKKANQHSLHIWTNLLSFFWLLWTWRFPLAWLLFRFQISTTAPILIPCHQL